VLHGETLAGMLAERARVDDRDRAFVDGVLTARGQHVLTAPSVPEAMAIENNALPAAEKRCTVLLKPFSFEILVGVAEGTRSR